MDQTTNKHRNIQKNMGVLVGYKEASVRPQFLLVVYRWSSELTKVSWSNYDGHLTHYTAPTISLGITN